MSLPAVSSPAVSAPSATTATTGTNADTGAHAHPSFFGHLPVSAFAMVMGLSGLALVWAKVAQTGWLPGLAIPIASSLGIAAFAVFVVLFLAYLRKWIRQPALVREEWGHPVKSSFFGAISVSFALLGAVALGIFSPLAEPLWLIGISLQILVMISVLNVWVHRDNIQAAHASPVWFIPAVGNVVIPLAGVRLGFIEISWWFFAIGLLFWGILLTLVLARLLFVQPSMPNRLIPTLCIFLAPPTVGFLSWVLLTGQYPDSPGLDPAGHLFFGLSLFFALFLVTQIPRFTRLPFYISWWAFSFPVAAFTTACMVYQSFVPFWPLQLLAACMVGLASLLIVWLFLRTLLAIWRREPQFVE